ncbi:hypothetical protein NTK89_002332 [Vibrio fluvialis]|nr:hypothetical protein [Vibrio fluvialis]
MSSANSFSHAHAILIKTTSGRRYFCGFGKAQRVQTAWSLAGAKLFLVDMTVMSHMLGHTLEVNEIAEILKSKGKDFEIVRVSVEA